MSLLCDGNKEMHSSSRLLKLEPLVLSKAQEDPHQDPFSWSGPTRSNHSSALQSILSEHLL